MAFASVRLASKRTRLWLGAAALLGSGACATSHVQVRESKPHADVRVSIAHRDEQKHQLYDDYVTIDGAKVAIGKGRGGHVSLRLPPGIHRLEISSALLHYDYETRARPEPVPERIGASPQFGTPKTFRSEPVRSAELRCEQPVDLLVGQGDEVQINMTVGPERACAVCTGNPMGPCGR